MFRSKKTDQKVQLQCDRSKDLGPKLEVQMLKSKCNGPNIQALFRSKSPGPKDFIGFVEVLEPLDSISANFSVELTSIHN